MKTIRQLKEDLRVNQDLIGLMDVLKGAAVFQYRSFARKVGRFSAFLEAFDGFFQDIDFSQVQHPFSREQGPLAILIVTSNEGFMGGLNARVINEALGNPEAGEAQLIVIGDQGAAYLKGIGKEAVPFGGVRGDEAYVMALKMKEHIIQEARAGHLGRLVVYYPKPVSSMAQKVERLRLLPCTQLFERKGPVEKRKKVIFESSVDDIIEYLVETWIIQKLFEVFEDSKLAELSARTLRLEESSQVLLERRKEIRYQYFREYHEVVDSGMRDLFSAQILRKREREKTAQGEMV